MISFFPKQISERAIPVYLISLVVVSVVFFSHAMGFGFIALGCICVIGFFTMVVLCSKNWRSIPEKRFLENVFYTALALRVVWVVVSYFIDNAVTGQPFEFGAADSLAYHEDAKWLA